MQRDGSAESADAGAGLAEGQARVAQAFDAAEADPKRQLQSLLECLSGLFYRCELSAPWRMSFVSKGVDDLTGYTAEELDQQAGWVSIMLEQDRGGVESEVAAAIAERRTFDLAYRIRHKAGEIRWVSERGHAVYAEDGPTGQTNITIPAGPISRGIRSARTASAAWSSFTPTIRSTPFASGNAASTAAPPMRRNIAFVTFPASIAGS
jgi:PAS domain S-box-containing protein